MTALQRSDRNALNTGELNNTRFEPQTTVSANDGRDAAVSGKAFCCAARRAASRHG